MNITSAEMAMNNSNTTLIYSIQNPLTFIYNIIALPYDWYTTNKVYQNNTLWSDGVKTHYDPCPHNWRIPKDGAWEDFMLTTARYYIRGSVTSNGDYTATNGRLYLSIAWYPAVGCRGYAEGRFFDIGYLGYYWVSTGSEEDAESLYFDMSTITPTMVYRRANGFPVRCVQE